MQIYATREVNVNDMKPIKIVHAWKTMFEQFNVRTKKKRSELATDHINRAVRKPCGTDQVGARNITSN